VDPRTNARQSILVIDDEEVVRILFKSLLEDSGYQALLAVDGQEGIRLLEQHHPAVALVDKNLPDMSGLELIASEKKRHPNTEFIMITGYASLDSAVKAMELGAFSYLTKPFEDMDIVLDRIRAALEVNNLRIETSLLRTRLDSLSGEPPGAAAPPAAPAPGPAGDSRLAVRVARTISFLESFLGKRETPPLAAAWARTVDMIEQEIRDLKLAIQKDREQG